MPSKSRQLDQETTFDGLLRSAKPTLFCDPTPFKESLLQKLHAVQATQTSSLKIASVTPTPSPFSLELLALAKPTPRLARPEFLLALRHLTRETYAKRLVERKSGKVIRVKVRSEKPSLIIPLWDRVRELFSIPRALAASVLLSLSLGSVGIYANNNPSVTNRSNLFVIKKTIEQAQLALSFSDEARIQTLLSHSQKRLDEASYLASQGIIDTTTLQAMNERVNTALDVLDSVQNNETKLQLASVISSASNQHIEQLQTLADTIIDGATETASIDAIPTEGAIAADLSTLAQTINVASVSSDPSTIVTTAATDITSLSVPSRIMVTSLPNQIFGNSGILHLYATVFNQAGDDISADSSLVMHWSVASGGTITTISPTHAVLERTSSQGSYGEILVITSATFQNTTVNKDVSFSFLNPLSSIVTTTSFGDVLDVEKNLPATISSQAIDNTGIAFNPDSISYAFEIISGPITLSSNDKQNTKGIVVNGNGAVSLKALTTHSGKTVSSIVSFTVVGYDAEATPTPTPHEVIPTEKPSKTPTKEATSLPEKNIYIKMASSKNILTEGQIADISITLHDDQWNILRNEQIQLTLVGVGTIGPVTVEEDGNYHTTYSAPSSINKNSSITITATLLSAIPQVSQSISLNLAERKVIIQPGSVSVRPNEVFTLPIAIKVSPSTLQLREGTIILNLPSDIELISGGTWTAKGIVINDLSPNLQLRIKNTKLNFTKIRVSIDSAVFFDSNGYEVESSKQSGYITITGGSVDKKPTPTEKVSPVVSPTNS